MILLKKIRRIREHEKLILIKTDKRFEIGTDTLTCWLWKQGMRR
ncbi:hypothetical protein HDEF_1931 [Candidatus Hamiltonella defensa 5AT (Acyrthosiphon pisum)]|uniref:Uncharacterized protein n=1 Tax=Hamiltonella defensa subsp. Acyrthosiphon pisum (strain 5AT) TaxID=572265 RepID=C4K7H6_HAMD5|nr:hypothetical protein HDEF_1931 [Candidatus Hamiltonella defensa 5AT (Acyrthosiphon pisum)]